MYDGIKCDSKVPIIKFHIAGKGIVLDTNNPVFAMHSAS